MCYFLHLPKTPLLNHNYRYPRQKNALEHEDPFVSCWIKSGIISLIDSILFQNNIVPNPVHALSSMRGLKQKNTNQFCR